MAKIKAILVKPYQRARIVNIEHTLKNFQDIVGGLIQVLYPWEDQVAIIADEEGKLKHYPLNRLLEDEDGEPYDVVVGTFLIVGLTYTDFSSLSDDLAEKYLRKFREPEDFIKFSNGQVFRFKKGVRPKCIV